METPVMPAKAGIQGEWIPAYAGMTQGEADFESTS